MWCLAACFLWSLAGLSRWPLQCAKGESQCHERGAHDSDLRGGTGLAGWSDRDHLGQLAGHQPCMVAANSHVLNISRMSAVQSIIFTMTRIRSYGPSNLVSCRLASKARDWAGWVLRLARDVAPPTQASRPFALALPPSQLHLDRPSAA